MAIFFLSQNILFDRELLNWGLLRHGDFRQSPSFHKGWELWVFLVEERWLRTSLVHLGALAKNPIQSSSES